MLCPHIFTTNFRW